MRSLIINAQHDNQCAALICRRKNREANSEWKRKRARTPASFAALPVAYCGIIGAFSEKVSCYIRLSAEISERISNQIFFRTEIINTAKRSFSKLRMNALGAAILPFSTVFPLCTIFRIFSDAFTTSIEHSFKRNAQMAAAWVTTGSWFRRPALRKEFRRRQGSSFHAYR